MQKSRKELGKKECKEPSQEVGKRVWKKSCKELGNCAQRKVARN